MNDQPVRAERRKISMRVEFIVDADVIRAESINLSDTGIAFETDAPIRVWMRFGEEQDLIPGDQQAELVWAKREPEGKTTYGLQFVENS